ncbi:MAG: hypothetical protein EOM24_23545, partial [Chloroflexia bacterium]|nr:hypothetical protein [Chloroflexia bacterium]
MELLESTRKEKKFGFGLLIGAIFVFAIGSGILDALWQAREGIAARVFAWVLIYAFLSWALLRQMSTGLRLDVFGALLALLALTLWIRFPLMSFQSEDYINC